MDELGGSLFYLIPIALVVFRVLSAITANAKKNSGRNAKQENNPAEKQPQTRQVPPFQNQPLERQRGGGFLPGQVPAGQPRPAGPPSARPAQKPVQPARPASPPNVPDPAMREIIKRFTPEQELPHWEREKRRQPPVKPQPAPAKVRQAQSPARQINVFEFPPAAEKPPKQAGETQAAKAPDTRRWLPVRLSPLQQGLMWSEILGTPKGLLP